MPIFGRKPPSAIESARTPREIAATFSSASGPRTWGAWLSRRPSTHTKAQSALAAASKAKDPAVQRGLMRQAHAHATEWLSRHAADPKSAAYHRRANSMRSLMTSLDKHEEAHRDYYASGMISSGPGKALGSGQINTVYKTNFAGGGTEYAGGRKQGRYSARDKDWVFKASDEQEQGIGKHSAMAPLGDVRLEKTDLTERNVLVSQIASNMGTSVIPETRKAIHEGQVGSAMEVAPGQSPLYTGKRHFSPEMQADLVDMSAEDMPGNLKRDQKGWYQDAPMFRSHDYENATSPSGRSVVGRTQRDLLDLQAVDYVTNAGVDRHAGNLHYDHKTGGVQGIDNDYAFGTLTKHADDDAKMRGLPPMLHASTAAKLKGMDSDTFAKTLGSLSGEERQAAITRYSALKEHVDRLRESGGIKGGLRIKANAAAQDAGGSVKERAKRFEARPSFDAATYRHLTHEKAAPSYLKSLHADTHAPATRGDKSYGGKK